MHLDRAERAKKASERSEVIVAFAFYIILEGICKKLPLRIERKRDSIEFERVKRSENQGQFFMTWAFNYFGSRLADLHLVLPNEVPQLCC